MDWIELAQDRERWRAEHGNEFSGSIKCWEFLVKLRTCRLLKKDSAHWSWLVSQTFSHYLLFSTTRSSNKQTNTHFCRGSGTLASYIFTCCITNLFFWQVTLSLRHSLTLARTLLLEDHFILRSMHCPYWL
jgi:hypothetical protein